MRRRRPRSPSATSTSRPGPSRAPHLSHRGDRGRGLASRALKERSLRRKGEVRGRCARDGWGTEPLMMRKRNSRIAGHRLSSPSFLSVRLRSRFGVGAAMRGRPERAHHVSRVAITEGRGEPRSCEGPKASIRSTGVVRRRWGRRGGLGGGSTLEDDERRETGEGTEAGRTGEHAGRTRTGRAE